MARYIMQWDGHPIHLGKVLCSLLETQSLVDLTVMCHSYSIKVHKCVLAANSVYFRERLQKDMAIDRVVINGIKQVVFKCLIEFMYCGETSVAEDNVHEFIAAAKYFKIFGITVVIPEKLGLEAIDPDDLLIKPPVFFSKNEKTKSMKDTLHTDYADKNIKMLLNDNDYTFNNSRTSRPIKVTDEARVALAKEEAASRFALEMLKKDITNTSNVFVIDETCTEATVETNLTPQYENANNMIQIQEFVLENEIPDGKNINLKMNDMGNLLEMKPKQSPSADEKIFDNQIVYKSNDGSYVNVNNQMLNQINNHTVSYEVLPETNQLALQQYICHDFEYNVDNNSTSENYEVPKDNQRKLTYNELVAETVSEDYESDIVEPYTENSGTSVKDEIQGEIENLLTNHDNSNTSTTSNDMSICEDSNQNTMLKKKRGRPAKRKLEKINSEPKQMQCFFNDNATDFAEFNKVQILSKEDNKENDVPNDSVEDLLSCDIKKVVDKFEEKVSPVRNRRQTRSSTKSNL